MLAKTKENDVIDRLLYAEMDECLGYKKNDNSGNSRNGYTTESVMADVREWQNSPLEKSYPILFLDALRVNLRQDGKNINKALYVALAINWEGRKEVLGLWLADTEGAKFWMGVLTDIKNRGVEDILIACMESQTSFASRVFAKQKLAA